MKKLLILLPAFIGLLWSCNPMEDTYNDLDNKEQPYNQSITYTLTSADYSTASKAALVDAANASDTSFAKLISSQQAFNTHFTANDYVPAVLAKNFIALKKNSSAVVTYNANLEDISYLADYSGATGYTLVQSDYDKAGVIVAKEGYFIPSSTAADNLPNILKTAISTPTDGKIVLVSYKASTVEPAGQAKPVNLFKEDYQSYAAYDTIKNNGWIKFVETGAKAWQARIYSGNAYAQVTANGAPGECVAWMISPEIDLSKSSTNLLSFYVNVGYYNATCLQVLVTEDFNASDINASTWDDITSNFTIPTTPTSGYGTLASAGSFDLSSYTGKIRIAFKYSGDGANSKTTTYQIDNVKVDGTSTLSPSLGLQYNDYYKYTAATTTWALSTTGICIQPLEYTQMGVANNRFTSSVLPANYIPSYLKNKFPYALEGDVKVVAYNYYSSGSTSIRADEYRYKSGAWTNYKGIVTKTDQFVHTGEEWIFDPTVHMTPSSEDFQLLVNYVYTNLSRSYGSSYGNDEFYYGASAYYKNFDLRLSNKTTYNIPGFDTGTDAEKIAKTWSMLEEGISIMLGLKYTSAQSDINGIPIYYWITFVAYENTLAKNTYVGIFQWSTEGATPAFVRVKSVEDAQVAAGNLTATQVGWNRPTK